MDDLISRQAAYATLSEYYHHRAEIQHEALREALDRVPSAQRWIPVTERLPEPGKHVLLCVPHECYDSDIGYHQETIVTEGYFTVTPPHKRKLDPYVCIQNDLAVRIGNDVVAWMPLPEPWKGGQDGT